MNKQAQDRKAFEDWQAESAASIAESPSHVYRECAIRLMGVMNMAMEWCSTSREKMWGCMFALDHPNCLGRSMSDIANQIKVSRATISELATRFCEENNLPPSSYMKCEAAQDAARQLKNKTK